ncbi:MAG: heme lyase CcmF/NrfE family subunit [Acidimicrobiales bacterium]
MIANLGTLGVLLAFAASITGIIVAGWGLVVTHRAGGLEEGSAYLGGRNLLRSVPLYAALLACGALVATAAMQAALFAHDFSIIYVAEVGSRQTPLLYTITGMWSSLAGSILLWGLVLSGYIAVLAYRHRRQASDPFYAWVLLVCYGVSAFFFGIMLGPANPFATFSGPHPSNGVGPNPLLQNNVLVLVHPPLLYLGYVGFTIPFAYAIAALATGNLQGKWQFEARKWTMFAWACLGAGILLGAWWSYQVLGWGGFWAWDPVENAALLPWLVGAAYIHSSMATERNGAYRVWTVSLVIAAFCLTILGTFLTRSGVVESVHAFTESDVGAYILILLGVSVVTGVSMLAWRGDMLRSSERAGSFRSREGMLLVQNVLFALLAGVILLGTLFPLVYQAFKGTQVTVGGPYFNTLAMPLAIMLLLLMGIAPVIPWGVASKGVLKRRLLIPAWAGGLTAVSCVAVGMLNIALLVVYSAAAFVLTASIRQAYLHVRAARVRHRSWVQAILTRESGGYLAHVGITVIAVALASAVCFANRGSVTLAPGSSATFAGQSIEYLGQYRSVTPSRHFIGAKVMVDGQGPYKPGVSWFGSAIEPVGTPALDSGPLRDVYLTLESLPKHPRGKLTIGVTVQPLVMWLWLGAGMTAGGILLALLDRRHRPERVADGKTGVHHVPIAEQVC